MKSKGVATTVVRMLARFPEEQATLAAVTFLEHEAVDVLDAVLDLVESRAKTAAVVAAVSAHLPSIPASRKKRVEQWLGAQPVETARRVLTPRPREGLPAPHVARAAIDALASAPAHGPWPRVLLEDPAPRLDPARAVTPIADHDELFDAVTRALEAEEDRVTVERVLDAVSRMGAPLSALPAARVKPALKRAKALYRPDRGEMPLFVASWLMGAAALSDDREGEPTPATFTRARLTNILRRLSKGKTQPLLSCPANERFFVDPRALVARALAGHELDVVDAVISLLRLAPDRRVEALAAAERVPAPFGAPLRHALGATTREVTEDHALWIAAARARNPGHDDPLVKAALPGLGPDAGEAARYTFEWTRRHIEGYGYHVEYHARFAPDAPEELHRDHLPLLLVANQARSFGDEGAARSVFSLFPVDRRSLFVWGTLRLRANVDASDAEWANHVALEPLLDPDVPLDDVALMLLAIGTNTKEPRENALATDALVATIEDGRVVGPELGRVMASLWHPLHEGAKWVRRPTGGRWARTLSTVARTSPLHTEIVRRVVESLFAAPLTVVPPDVHALLEVWIELCEQAGTGVHDPAARAWLATNKTKKTGALATRLLALDPRPSTLAEEAHAMALEARWARAARWSTF